MYNFKLIYKWVKYCQCLGMKGKLFNVKMFTLHVIYLPRYVQVSKQCNNECMYLLFSLSTFCSVHIYITYFIFSVLQSLYKTVHLNMLFWITKVRCDIIVSHNAVIYMVCKYKWLFSYYFNWNRTLSCYRYVSKRSNTGINLM